MERIVKHVNHLLKEHVKGAKLVLIQARETLTKPNVKSNYVVLEIINSIPVRIVLNWKPVKLLEAGTPKKGTNIRSTNKQLHSLRKMDIINLPC